MQNGGQGTASPLIWKQTPSSLIGCPRHHRRHIIMRLNENTAIIGDKVVLVPYR